MTDNVVLAFGATDARNDIRVRMIKSFTENLDALITDGFEPTAFVSVVFNDASQSRTGWSSSNSTLPANAVLGIAVSALISNIAAPS
jgi:hypothetical protein